MSMLIVYFEKQKRNIQWEILYLIWLKHSLRAIMTVLELNDSKITILMRRKLWVNYKRIRSFRKYSKILSLLSMRIWIFLKHSLRAIMTVLELNDSKLAVLTVKWVVSKLQKN